MPKGNTSDIPFLKESDSRYIKTEKKKSHDRQEGGKAFTFTGRGGEEACALILSGEG